MIGSIKHKGLEELFETGKSRHVAPELRKRILKRLDAISAAFRPEELQLPGFDFHALRGLPKRYSVHVNGPWCLTFGWDDKFAIRIDLEQYH